MRIEESRMNEIPNKQKDPEKVERVQTGDLDNALKRIHSLYGNDLQAFFRDARKAVLKKYRPVSEENNQI